MFKRILRAPVPGAVRRFLRKRKLDRWVAACPRRVVEHRYGGVVRKVEPAAGADWFAEVRVGCGLEDAPPGESAARFFPTAVGRDRDGSA